MARRVVGGKSITVIGVVSAILIGIAVVAMVLGGHSATTTHKARMTTEAPKHQAQSTPSGTTIATRALAATQVEPKVATPPITAAAYGASAVLTLQTRVTELASRLTDAHMITATEFQVTLSDIQGGVTTTNVLTTPDTIISSVDVGSVNGTARVTIRLAAPQQSFQVSVGEDQEVQISFN